MRKVDGAVAHAATVNAPNRCAAAVPWLRGEYRTARCDDPVVPLTRYCAEHLIAHAGHHP